MQLAAAPPGGSPSGILSPGMLSTLGVILITICVVSMLRRRLRDRHSGGHAHQPRSVERTKQDARERLEARRTTDNALAEAEELVRRMAAHLDTKSARLEKLIRDADERIGRLGAAPDTMTEPRRQPTRPRPPAPDRATDPISQNVYRLADEGLPSIEIAQRLSEGVGKVELILALRDN